VFFSGGVFSEALILSPRQRYAPIDPPVHLYRKIRALLVI